MLRADLKSISRASARPSQSTQGIFKPLVSYSPSRSYRELPNIQHVVVSSVLARHTPCLVVNTLGGCPAQRRPYETAGQH